MRLLARFSLVTLVFALIVAALSPPARASDTVTVGPAVQTCALPAVVAPDLSVIAHANLLAPVVLEVASLSAPLPPAIRSPVAIAVATDPARHALRHVFDAPDTVPTVPDGLRLLTRQS